MSPASSSHNKVLGFSFKYIYALARPASFTPITISTYTRHKPMVIHKNLTHIMRLGKGEGGQKKKNAATIVYIVGREVDTVKRGFFFFSPIPIVT
jgi:hypothetical protein